MKHNNMYIKEVLSYVDICINNDIIFYDQHENPKREDMEFLLENCALVIMEIFQK